MSAIVSVCSCRYCRYIADMECDEELKRVLAQGGGQHVEFKEKAFSDLDVALCAFSNAAGGTVYVGVADDGTVVGTPALDNRLRAQIMDVARNCDPSVQVSIRSLGRVLAIDIVESTNKPVRVKSGFYLRVGATSQKLSRDEIVQFFIRENRIIFDRQVYREATAEDVLDPRQIELFRNRAQLDADLLNLQLLENLGCVVEIDGVHHFTMAGILLFAKDPQAVVPQATLTLIHMQDESAILRQEIVRGTLFSQVERGYQFLAERVSSVRINSLLREDALVLPAYVLRELLVNAVIHRDYSEASADVTVKLYPEKLEIANPGTVSQHIPLPQLLGRSFRRNPTLAEFFYRARYIERAGTGLLRVEKALQELQLPPLQFAEEGMYFVATVLREPSGLSGRLNERQRASFAEANLYPITTKAYAAHFGVSDRTARNDLVELVNRGYLRVVRESRRVMYDVV